MIVGAYSERSWVEEETSPFRNTPCRFLWWQACRFCSFHLCRGGFTTGFQSLVFLLPSVSSFKCQTRA